MALDQGLGFMLNFRVLSKTTRKIIIQNPSWLAKIFTMLVGCLKIALVPRETMQERSNVFGVNIPGRHERLAPKRDDQALGKLKAEKGKGL